MKNNGNKKLSTKIKKFILSFSLVSSFGIAPVATSCSSNTELSFYDNSILSQANSQAAINKLENLWLNKVLNTIYKTKKVNFDTFADNDQQFKDDFTNALKWYVSNKLIKNPEFLTSFYSTVLKNDKSKDQKVVNKAKDVMLMSILDIAQLNDYVSKVVDEDFISTVLFDAIKNDEKKIVYSGDNLSIKKEILHLLISKKYLSISKDEWEKVFIVKKDGLSTSVKDLTNSTTPNFPMIIESLNASLGFKWAVSISGDEVSPLIGPSSDLRDKTLTEADGYLNVNSSILLDKVKNKYSIKNKIAPTGHANKDYPDLFGYEGVSKVTGEENLSTEKYALKSVTQMREGYFQDKKIITEGIDILSKDTSAINIQRVVMMLPLYDETKKELTFKNVFGTVSEDETVQKIEYALYSNNSSSIYDDAQTYFIEKKDPVLLEVHNKEIGKIWTDQFNLKFIKVVD